MTIRIQVIIMAGLLGFMMGKISGCTSQPEKIGLLDGKLHPCPTSPNCVCSCDNDTEHAIAPLPSSSSAEAAMERLSQIVTAMEGSQIQKREPNYMHVTFTTKLMRFVDDIEFFIPANNEAIQVRSASRTGYSDMGVNRKRVETIRQELEKSP